MAEFRSILIIGLGVVVVVVVVVLVVLVVVVVAGNFVLDIRIGFAFCDTVACDSKKKNEIVTKYLAMAKYRENKVLNT